MKMKFHKSTVIFFLSAFFVLFYNITFFTKILSIYPIREFSLLPLVSMGVILFFVIVIVLHFLLINKIIKWQLAVLFYLATVAAFVMDQFGVAIDEHMLVNVFKTNASEALELVTPKFLLYLLFFFILPTFLISRIQFEETTLWKESIKRVKIIFVSVLVIAGVVGLQGKMFASFFRTHKPIRYYTNPTYFIYSISKLIGQSVSFEKKEFEQIGLGSIIPETDRDRELVILVVGETARRDHFSLNGYKKITNPLLSKVEDLYSFKNVTSCGTSTAVSVPCIFSNLGRGNFSIDRGLARENALDVLLHTDKVEVLWRDNNSNSKGVANRATYQDYKNKDINPICDEVECRDIGMLVGLQKFIDDSKKKDIFIVLHQLGNHGPAYYKRYPKEFEIFKPTCKTSELSSCTNEQISNAYDNALLYTDFFLNKVIELLKSNSEKFSTSMVYVSDHGESLGENGVYLHSMPYMIAPKEQIEVPLIAWFGGSYSKNINKEKLKAKLENPYSHDNVFHSVLGLFDVESNVYKKELDIFHDLQLK